MSDPEKDPLQRTNSAEQTSVDDEANSQCCKRKCIKWIKKHPYVCAGICLGLVVGTSLLIWLGISLSGHKIETNSDIEHTNTSRLKGNGSCEGFGENNGTNDLFINRNVSCKNNCVLLEENITEEYIPHEWRSCDKSNGNIKNSNCYFCNNTCITKDELILMNRIKCIDSHPVEIDCCLVAQMDNFNRKTEEKYRCYSASVHEQYNKLAVQPLLHCPFGKKGERCQQHNTKPFICKCFKYNHKFQDQEELTECNKKPKRITERIVECFMLKTIDCVQHNCLCSRTMVADESNKNSFEKRNKSIAE